MRTAPVAGLALLVFLTLPAHAQENPEQDVDLFETPTTLPPPDAAPDIASIPVEPLREEKAETMKPEGRPPQQLEEIVVTATKREKSIREVPVSINAINGEQLEKMAAHDLQDYIALTPGITLQEGQWGDVQSRNITIRGVGSAPLTNQTVGQFIGDTPMTDPYSNFVTPDLDPFDLQNVEILKGPQGTYFGASALNGAIRYVPNAPELGTWNARGYVDYLSIKDGGTEPSYGAALNVPIGDYFALRAMGVLQNTPGVIDNLQRDEVDADSRSKWSGRIAARWEPTNDLAINLMWLKQQAQIDDTLPVDNADEQLSNNNHPGDSQTRSGFSLLTADIRQDLGDLGTLVAQGSRQNKTALVDVDAGTSTGSRGIESLRGYLDADITGTTGEIRLVSTDGGRWNWILGVFGLDYSAEVTNDLYVANTAALGVISQIPIIGPIATPRGLSLGGQTLAPLDASEYAVFGELSRLLGDRWELTAGARFYRTNQSGLVKQTGTLGPLIGDSVVDQDDDGISPKVSLSFQANDNVMAYATISRGYQFGGVNATTSLLPFDNPVTGIPIPLTFKSSTLWNREIGIRTDWFERTLRADLTYFNLDWSDAQFNETRQNLLLLNTYVSNVGKVNAQGAEGSLTWLTPIEGLSFNTAFAYTKAVTKVPFNAADGSEVPTGTQMPATPRWQTATSASYSLFIGQWVSAATLTHTFSGEAYNNIQHGYPIYDKSLLNLNLSVARPGMRFSPALTVVLNNLTDERQVVGYTEETSLVSPQLFYSRPRSISVRLSMEFE